MIIIQHYIDLSVAELQVLKISFSHLLQNSLVQSKFNGKNKIPP